MERTLRILDEEREVVGDETALPCDASGAEVEGDGAGRAGFGGHPPITGSSLRRPCCSRRSCRDRLGELPVVAWHGKQAQAQSASIAARVESTRSLGRRRPGSPDRRRDLHPVDRRLRDRRDRARRLLPHALSATSSSRPSRPGSHTKPLQNRAHRSRRSRCPQYRLAATADADRLEARATAASEDVKKYIQRADNYTLAVVLFATSLFFAGISTRLRDQSTRIAVLGMGYVLFAGAAIWIATFPVTVSV